MYKNSSQASHTYQSDEDDNPYMPYPYRYNPPNHNNSNNNYNNHNNHNNSNNNSNNNYNNSNNNSNRSNNNKDSSNPNNKTNPPKGVIYNSFNPKTIYNSNNPNNANRFTPLYKNTFKPFPDASLQLPQRRPEREDMARTSRQRQPNGDDLTSSQNTFKTHHYKQLGNKIGSIPNIQSYRNVSYCQPTNQPKGTPLARQSEHLPTTRWPEYRPFSKQPDHDQKRQEAPLPAVSANPQIQKQLIMSCGHLWSAEQVVQIIKSSIQEQRHEVRCPCVMQEGVVCNQSWEFKYIGSLQVLGKQELEQLEETLSMNFLKSYAKQCPSCQMSITKMEFNCNRVVCNTCHLPFCYLCLHNWTPPPPLTLTLVDWDTLQETTQDLPTKPRFCGKHLCYATNYQLKDLPKRQFKLMDNCTFRQPRVVTLTVPQARPCPFCGIVNHNHSDRKHTTCKGCLESFCWICMAAPINQVWPCGKINEMCLSKQNSDPFINPRLNPTLGRS